MKENQLFEGRQLGYALMVKSVSFAVSEEKTEHKKTENKVQLKVVIVKVW